MTAEALRIFIFDRIGLDAKMSTSFTGKIYDAVDSLEYVDLLLAIEQEIGCDIKFEDLPPFETFDQLIAYFLLKC